MVVLRNYNCDGALLLFWDGLGLDARLYFSSDKVVNELANTLLIELLVLREEREFLVLNRLLNGKGRPFANLKIKIVSVLAKGFGVDSSEVNSAFVLFSNRLKGSSERFAVFGGFSENIGERNTGLKFASLATAPSSSAGAAT